MCEGIQTKKVYLVLEITILLCGWNRVGVEGNVAAERLKRQMEANDFILEEGETARRLVRVS